MSGRDQRRARIRKTIRGTSDRPRLVVFRSNRYFYSQIIDDSKGVTIVSVNKLLDAAEAGKELATKAKEAKVTAVIFDRAGYAYHGNIKKLADAAREGGLKF